MSERNVMNIFQCDPAFTVHILGDQILPICPIQLVTAVFVFCSIIGHAILCFLKLPATVLDCVNYFILLEELAVFLAYMVTRLTKQGESKKVYTMVLQVDADVNAAFASHKDWRLQLMASLYLIIGGLIISYITISWPRPYLLPFLSFIPVSQMILEVAMLKYVIAKRLRYIRSEEEYMDRIEDSISLTRQLLECNKRLNRSSSLIATFYAMYTCQLVLQYLYQTWAMYVAGLTMLYEPAGHPLIETGIVITIASITALLAACSSCIVFEVDEVRLELDATYSARNCTQAQEQLIYLFLMELHQTPVELSALGFYEIGISSISKACATFLSYLLVLIQYT